MLTLGAGRPEVEVLEAGEGAPLLFLHGAGGIPVWEGVLPLLSQRYHVYAPLLPGFGRSTGLDLLDDQLDLFLHGFDVMQALGLERPYVVGESMGGWIAAEMAALRPAAVGRLALAAPIGLWRDEAPVVDLFGYMTHEMVPYLFHDTSSPPAQAMLAVSQLISDKDDRSEAQVEQLIDMMRGFRTAAKFLFPIPENGLERRLWRITAPTVIIWGNHDRFVSPMYADLFAEKIPSARVVRVPDSGHVIGLERPEPFAAAVFEWGRQNGNRPTAAPARSAKTRSAKKQTPQPRKQKSRAVKAKPRAKATTAKRGRAKPPPKKARAKRPTPKRRRAR